ncbi:MAG: hypothetical protein ABI472_09945 [Ginsengibacter sp.]
MKKNTESLYTHNGNSCLTFNTWLTSFLSNLCAETNFYIFNQWYYGSSPTAELPKPSGNI